MVIYIGALGFFLGCGALFVVWAYIALNKRAERRRRKGSRVYYRNRAKTPGDEPE